ncbi:XisI protein [Chloroflexales bacterium ZM16-3]|nr:XisI protein [Chloroflexales bacterium ZM16-3]
MDKLAQYRTYIEQILREYSAYKPSYGEVEVEIVIDHLHDHYQLLTVGWNKHQRIHGTLLHIDIRDGKIWIQQDGTEEGVANRFVAQGVPKTDIVLGFQPPYKRPYTDFATG